MNFFLKSKILFLALAFAACSSDEQVKYEQYVIAGEQLYNKNCSNCHGAEGQGLRNLYPPLKNSDFLINQNAVICIIKNGSNDTLKVNGKTFNQKMPANKKLYDLDIAQIVTFINDNWGKKGIVEVEVVGGVVCE